MARISYQDGLSEGVTAEPLPCSNCNTKTPAWALYLSEDEEPLGYICGRCIADHAASTALPEPEVIDPWATERGLWLKAERNLALSYDATGWAIMPDSPLSVEGQAEYFAYRALLNRMTVDFTPETWVWPQRPSNAYAVNS